MDTEQVTNIVGEFDEFAVLTPVQVHEEIVVDEVILNEW